MSARLRMTDVQWGALTAHLLGDGDEHAALLVCGVVDSGAGTALTVRRVECLVQEDLLESSALHLSVSPIALARVTKAARLEGTTVVLCHSHPWPGTVAPSPLDLDTEETLCGRSLAARLAPRPVGALILGTESFSGRLWKDGRSRNLDSIVVIGDHIVELPEPDAGAPGEEVARQVLAWGVTGQGAIARATVAVVGVGGTGSHIVTQLAHLGVGHMRLVDPDVVEHSNLSRIVGAVPADVGRLKVSVLGEAARRINPHIEVEEIAASVIDCDPAVFAGVDIVVNATDGHGSRALVTEVVQQYVIPAVDLGVEVIPTEVSVQAGGQVRVLRPGRGCLHCADTLDPGLVREEYLTDRERAEEAKRGYLRGVEAPAPAVIALNGVVASIACLEICQLLARFLGGAPDRALYRANRRAVSTASIAKDVNCYVCGEHGLLGLGDARPLPIRRRPPAAEGT